MIELIKNKYIIILALMIIGVSYMTALDNKKTDEVRAQNGQIESVLYK